MLLVAVTVLCLVVFVNLLKVEVEVWLILLGGGGPGGVR